MKPSQVRRAVLEEHGRLRVLLEEIEALVERFEKGDAQVHGPLRDKGIELHDALCAHLDHEDDILAPALRDADAAGARAARRLADEHREQRELFAFLLGRLRDSARPTVLLAREMRNFVDLIRIDMQHEEEHELSEKVLRDDVLSVEPGPHGRPGGST